MITLTLYIKEHPGDLYQVCAEQTNSLATPLEIAIANGINHAITAHAQKVMQRNGGSGSIVSGPGCSSGVKASIRKMRGSDL